MGVDLIAESVFYAAILITTNLQHPANAEPKTERSPAPDWLMMSVGVIPLSIYLKT
jgi:hypothetical protein